MAARYAAMHAAAPASSSWPSRARGSRTRWRCLASSRRPIARQVLLAMGAPGLVTRLAPDRFGSAWTYAGDGVGAGTDSGRSSPPRIPVRQHLAARRSLRRRRASVGALGFAGDAQPRVRGGRARRAVRAARSGDADDFLTFAGAMGVRGASVTLPFKIDLLHRVEADELSRRVGAVNTVRRDGQRWSGTNTDVAGLLAPLQPRMNLAGVRATVLGAGGAARGAAVALAGAGARVTVRARRAEAAGADCRVLRVSVRRDAAAARQLGSGRQRDVRRHASRCRRRRRGPIPCSTAAWSTT